MLSAIHAKANPLSRPVDYADGFAGIGRFPRSEKSLTKAMFRRHAAASAVETTVSKNGDGPRQSSRKTSTQVLARRTHEFRQREFRSDRQLAILRP